MSLRIKDNFGQAAFKITIECDRDRVTEMVVNQFIHKNSMMFLSTSQ